ncbi:Fe(3+) ABC transporter substrate-binding protein [Noviherbaspirillum aridicola]|uniref:Iron deficiency-induced protein A n=1 Tax=Noviherbaspirillum aridicola TaxID=2849687 RepID=A0ABQ4Q6E4_9BURK|nr:Fe(3+) ABC transporter substrate-binding protein [Noviherbaspirillum aridicola]GIZ52375.1 iron deficiency-induced protein A [Noviherbaspirillum aridicola]
MKAAINKKILLAVLALAASSGHAQENVLNLYSARHYQTDEQLYANFTKQTGIKINRIEADDNALLERLKNEGKNSPADVILMVDAARLWRAQIEGLFQPVKSRVLDSRIPDNLRGKDDGKGAEWYGFSTRARVIVYNKANVNPADVPTYESLADPKNKGKVCTRSGSHPYMLSLIGSLIERNGEAATEKWAQGMVANFARPPRGGDTDQIKGVASGECGVALANSYYYARLLRSTKPEDKEMMSKVALVWPNQNGAGTHVNVSGGGVAKNAPHREAAVKFLEYLASDEAQGYFANGNNEWPVVASAVAKNETLEAMGKFKTEKISIATIGKNQIAAQKILDRVGYK